MTSPALRLQRLDVRLAIARLGPADPLPDWAAGPIVSITRTHQELSIVCPEERVPPGVVAERGWACLIVAGPLDFREVGVIASLAAPLRDAAISIFIVSTYDTDYLLIKAEDFDEAKNVLLAAGHELV